MKQGETINDFVLRQPNMGINEWLKLILEGGLTKYEPIILECADHHNKIEINHKAEFSNTISS